MTPRNISRSGIALAAFTLLAMVSLQTANAVTYTAGVAVGNSFTYQASTNWSTSSPPSFLKTFSGLGTIGFQVTRVSSAIVNGTATLTFTNGTATKTDAVGGDLSTGSGNVSIFLIPAGLNAGDSFPTGGGGGMNKLNSSSSVTVLGVSRTVEFYNVTQSGGGFSSSMWGAWDQATGALISIIFKTSLGSSGNGQFAFVITGTNVWSANILGLPPIIFYAIIGIIIVVVAAAAVYILRKGRHPMPPAQPAPATQSPSSP